MTRVPMRFLALASALLIPALPATAAVFKVTRTADTYDLVCDDDCSLREAVRAASFNPGEDTILLGQGVYTLTRAGAFEDANETGDLDVSGELILLGQGAESSTIDGGGLDRVLHVLERASLTVQGVTIRNGHVRNPTNPIPLPGIGGGIAGDVTVLDSVITGNRSDGSGGGLSGGVVTVRNSTISGNVANLDGGGIEAYLLTLENVTVSGNRATGLAGGIKIYSGDQVFDHITVTGNHDTSGVGGIFLESLGCPGSCPPYTVHLSRSIVARNGTSAESDCALPEFNGSGNVFGIHTGCGTNPDDQGGTPEAPLDPKLGPLADNGGPTPTHLPLAGSPAIDSSGSCTGADQRGAARPADGNGDGQARCDAGAVEVSSSCIANSETLCLQNGRFQVAAHWKTAQGEGAAKSVPLTADSGSFWFFNADNLELLVKVLDGCGVNGRHWVFLTGLTDVEVEVRVTDTETGEIKVYDHPGRVAMQPRLDTSAFENCP